MKSLQTILLKYPLTLIVVGICLLLLLPQVFQQGLFFDGLTYSSVANNLALGRGTAWDPMYAEEIYPHFHEHPPLMFWIESWLMYLFNGAYYVEKIFSFLCAVFSGFLLLAVYKKLSDKSNLTLLWLPLLLWITVPKVFWSYNNNILENLLTVFVLASIYYFIKYLKQESKWKSLLFGTAFLFLGFMTKGLVALFPLVVLVLYALLFERSSKHVLRRIRDTFIVIGIFSMLLIAMFVLIPESYAFFSSYFDVQVMSSISGKRRTGSRIMLLYDMFMELIPMLIFITLSVVTLFKHRIKRIQVSTIVFYLGIALSSTLPLLISPKLSVFYLVPAFPFYALAAAEFLSPFYQKTQTNINDRFKLKKLINGIGYSTCIAAIIWTVSTAGGYYRDKETITDAQKIAQYNDDITTMSISIAMKNDWTTMAYFQRFHQISFNIHTDTLQFILLNKEETVPENYQKIALDLDKFMLVKRK